MIATAPSKSIPEIGSTVYFKRASDVRCRKGAIVDLDDRGLQVQPVRRAGKYKPEVITLQLGELVPDHEPRQKRPGEGVSPSVSPAPLGVCEDTAFDFSSISSMDAEPAASDQDQAPETTGVNETPQKITEPAKQPLPADVPTSAAPAGGFAASASDYKTFHKLTGKGRPPEVVNASEPSKEPLHGKKHQKQKGVLANGRAAEGVGKFEHWCGQVYPSDVAYPAWRALTKTATDVANICRAKMGYEKHKLKKKDPVFHFTVAEAERKYKITRPTFSKAIKLLLNVGFIEHARRGGMPDGVGVKALYRLIESWKTWEPPTRDNSNILKARAARNILPAKGP